MSFPAEMPKKLCSVRPLWTVYEVQSTGICTHGAKLCSVFTLDALESGWEIIFIICISKFRGLSRSRSAFFSHLALLLYLGFSARCAWRENGSRQEKREGGEQSGAHCSLNIPVLNMKIYYSIMCSVCKLEGNHMKRSQTKSLLCSNWPPPPPPSFVCFNWGRERETESKGERRGKKKKGEVCLQSRRNWKGAVHRLAASHSQTHRSTGEQHDWANTHQNRKEGLNPGILSAAVKLW